MTKRRPLDSALMSLAQAIAAGDAAGASHLTAKLPVLVTARFQRGATRKTAKSYYLKAIGCYVYAGETALHVAAAAYRQDILHMLIDRGADVRARDRRGVEPLHAAAVGMPGSRTWNPRAQAATITCLIGAGADPNAVDNSGVTPLHRAVRTRCTAAVRAVIEGGADA